MEEYTQITLDEWVQWKEDIRKKLAETANNFVYIGFRLKQIRDSGIYGGAADVFEFAQNEYGLSKSTVSRFIAINEKYSEGGNSLEIREEFKNFSSSKLSEMLTLPESECQLITERTTIKEIRDLKDFNRQQETEDDSGQQAAGMQGGHSGHRSPLEKCVIDFFRDKKECLNKVMLELESGCEDVKGMVEEINPSGQTSHRKGLIYLFLYDLTEGVKYKQLGVEEPVSMTWRAFLEVIRNIYSADSEDYHAAFYGEAEEEETGENTSKEPEKSVATSQQEEDGSDGKECAQDVKEEPEEKPGEEQEEESEEEPAETGKGEGKKAEKAPKQKEKPKQRAVSEDEKKVMEIIKDIKWKLDRIRADIPEDYNDIRAWRHVKGGLTSISEMVQILIRRLDKDGEEGEE